MTLNHVSLARLGTCHPDLQKLVLEVEKRTPIMVLYGHRTRTFQDEAVRSGHSKLMWPHSRHNTLPSAAVDIAPLPLNWLDHKAFAHMVDVVKQVAAELGIDVVCGADWKTLVDMPHVQLRELPPICVVPNETDSAA